MDCRIARGGSAGFEGAPVIQQSSGPPVVFGMGQCDPGIDPTCGASTSNLAGALSGLKWLAIAVGAWFVWSAFKGGR